MNLESTDTCCRCPSECGIVQSEKFCLCGISVVRGYHAPVGHYD
jgi:hypothetical protein